MDRLDIIISLLIPKYDESKYNVKGLSLEILKLCDGENSVVDMVATLKKDRQLIDNALSKLRSQQIIKSIDKGDKKVYVRLI
ncbi:MAG: hypothetical protein ABSC53_01125 [Bacteroidota bacterium]